MKKFIGDLSRADAELLESYAQTATTVLEFGVGGSTQIIAQAIPDHALFWSLETDPAWISTTFDKLCKLRVEHKCQFHRYDEWMAEEAEASSFDLIFDDGIADLRCKFAMRAFPLLTAGGALLFHDTRRIDDVRNVLDLIEVYFDEIENVAFNERVNGVSSNITAVRKKAKEPYVDWNVDEQRPSWATGIGTVPEDFWTND